jgi:hypothetical protein
MQFQGSVQQSLIKFNGIFVVYIILRMLLSPSNDSKVNVFLSIFFLCIFIMDVCLYRSKYKDSINALIIVHLIQFIPLLFGIYLTSSESFNILYFLLGFMIFKVFILLPYDNKKLEHLVKTSAFVAVSVSTLILTLATQSLMDALLSIIFILLCMFILISLFEGF